MATSIVFGLFAFITATSRYIPVSNSLLQGFYQVFPVGHWFFGLAGLGLFASASLCLNAYLGPRSAWRVVQFFTLPLLMAYEFWLFIADRREMSFHVVMLLYGTPLSGVLTNWAVLFGSTVLFLLGLVVRGAGARKGLASR